MCKHNFRLTLKTMLIFFIIDDFAGPREAKLLADNTAGGCRNPGSCINFTKRLISVIVFKS